MLALLAACGNETRIQGQSSWASADDAYRVQFVTPPWEVDVDESQELHLRIRAELFGATLDGSPPTHVFVLARVDGIFDVQSLIPPELRIDQSVGTTGFDPSQIPDGVDTSLDGLETGTDGLDLPPELVGVSLADSRDVALTELNHLITQQNADLVHELGVFEQSTVPGTMNYEVVVNPGVFVRVFYFPSRGNVVRAAFASSFDLNDDDVDVMAATIRTDAEVGERG